MKLKDQIAALIKELDALKDLEEMHSAYCEIICAKMRGDTHGNTKHTARCERMVDRYGFNAVAE